MTTENRMKMGRYMQNVYPYSKFQNKTKLPQKTLFFSRKWVRASIYIYAILSGVAAPGFHSVTAKKNDLHREVANATIFQNLTYVFLFIPVFYYRNRRTRKRNKYTHKNPYFFGKGCKVEDVVFSSTLGVSFYIEVVRQFHALTRNWFGFRFRGLFYWRS